MIIIKRFWKVIKRIVLILIILIVIFLGSIYGASIALYNGDFKACFADTFSSIFGKTKTQYVLILGVSEDISTELTDTVMVAGYNPETNKAFLVSIPRDTFVGKSKASASGRDKINAKYASSIQSSMDAAEKITGLKLDGYVVIKTSMLVEIVDLIGGVKFDVPIDMDYDDPTQDLHIHLSKGMQKIDGSKAEQLLRFRHNNDGTSYPVSYGDNDYGRMKTQRNFIKAVITQTLKPINILKITRIVNKVSDNIITSYKKNEILAYCFKLLDFDTNNLETVQIPGDSETLNRISFFVSNEKQTKSLIDECVSKINKN